MRVVAEGVEEKGQVEFLASQGCDMIQGFVFAKPMGGADYVDRMKKNMDRIKGNTDIKGGNTDGQDI